MWWKGIVVAGVLSAGLVATALIRSREKQPAAKAPVEKESPAGQPVQPVQPPPVQSVVDTSPPPIVLPIENLKRSDIQDTFDQARGGGARKHEATDILAPRGTPVVAVRPGVIQKLFVSQPGGNTIYLFDETHPFCYYYAHLDRYAEGLKEGMKVRPGQVIGYVGTSGNAPPDTPHLHFGVFALGPEKKWWEGTPLNPYPLLLEALEDL